MATLSKLAPKCKKCPHVDNCDDKRMVACAIMKGEIDVESNAKPMMAPILAPIINPVIRVDSIAEQVAEQIRKDFYKSMRCGFTGGLM